jgi:hypothetical protein
MGVCGLDYPTVAGLECCGVFGTGGDRDLACGGRYDEGGYMDKGTEAERCGGRH